MVISQLASAIYVDIVQGLKGFSGTPNISIEQIEDEIVEERLAILKEWNLKGILNPKNFTHAVNCVEIDCKSMSKCCNSESNFNTQSHFQIPQLLTDLKNDAISYIGSTDRMNPYIVYYDDSFLYHKYKKRNSHKPYVYIEPTPNSDGYFDGYIFNAPYVKQISIIGIFKDPRDLLEYACCDEEAVLNISSITSEIKKRILEKKLRYYKSYYVPVTPNTQQPK